MDELSRLVVGVRGEVGEPSVSAAKGESAPSFATISAIMELLVGLRALEVIRDGIGNNVSRRSGKTGELRSESSTRSRSPKDDTKHAGEHGKEAEEIPANVCRNEGDGSKYIGEVKALVEPDDMDGVMKGCLTSFGVAPGTQDQRQPASSVEEAKRQWRCSIGSHVDEISVVSVSGGSSVMTRVATGDRVTFFLLLRL